MAKETKISGKRSALEPTVHFMEVDGKRVYRFWNHRSETYVSEAMGDADMKDYLLYCAISNALEAEFKSSIDHKRDLSGRGWWDGGYRPGGVIEKRINEDGPDFAAANRHANRCAFVAQQAIKAYQAHLAAGGDPDVVPMVYRDETLGPMVKMERVAEE